MRKIGDHAVVLGAGIAGLVAARVLADGYQRVTVVERDRLTDSMKDRRGIRRLGTYISSCVKGRGFSMNCSPI